MALLDPPRCPNCQSLIDLTELWQAAPKSRNTIIARVGIACPVCGVKLRVLQGRAYLIGLMAMLVPLAAAMGSIFVAPVTQRSTDYYMRMGIFAVIVFGAVRFHTRNIPRLLTVRLLQDNETVQFPLVRPITPEAEEETAPSSALRLEPTEDDRPAWTCKACGEENPGNFNECWKCLAMRPEANA
jgi:RNase P subunit RPR2